MNHPHRLDDPVSVFAPCAPSAEGAPRRRGTRTASGPSRRLRHAAFALAAVSAAAAAMLFTMPARAALDSNANTSDHAINKPTGWWTYQNMTPSELQAKAEDLGARIVEVEVQSVTGRVPKLTARLVSNSGSYAIPGATLVWDRTQSQLSSHLTATNTRIIELERYDAGGGDIRYLAVLVPNTGATGRAWGWMPGWTKADIQSWATANNQRIIDLDSFGSGSSRRWNAVTVANSGDDYMAYDWDVNQTLAQVGARLSGFNGRLVKLERQSDGKYSFVQVNNTGSNGTAWWHMYGMSSLQAVNDFAQQMGSRPIDIVRYSVSGTTYFDAVMIDNLDSASRAVRSEFFEGLLDSNGLPRGIFSAYLRNTADNTVHVNFNASRTAETASALKALHLLHSMQQVNAGASLSGLFTYYNYPTSGAPKDACPNPAYENSSFDATTSFENGLDMMMLDSDNRTTRGVVLRYGMGAINATAAAAGLKKTVLRHNIGCGYGNPTTGVYSPSTLRNDTTAADLANLWRGVFNGTLLPNPSTGRTEFLESGNPGTGAGSGLQAIINEEAAALGLSMGDAAEFGAGVKKHGKGGGYGTCLGLASDMQQCGQKVTIGSSAGLIGLPIKSGQFGGLRWHAYGILYSDVKVTGWSDAETDDISNAYGAAKNEMFRSAIRSALKTWL
jgi:hypothetical protein